MIDNELLSCLFLLLSFISVWVFNSRLFASIMLCIALLINGVKTLTATDIMLLCTLFTGFWWLERNTTTKKIDIILWLLSLLICWWIFTDNMQSKMMLQDNIWYFTHHEVENYLLRHLPKIYVALIIAIFYSKPLYKPMHINILLRHSLPYIISCSTIFLLCLYFSTTFNIEWYVPELWLLWLISYYLVIALPEELVFRLYIQGNLTKFSKTQYLGIVSSIATTALIYTTSFIFYSYQLSIIIFIKSILLGYFYHRFMRVELTAILNTLFSFFMFCLFRFVI